jgi:hypothetical protein
MKTAAAHAAEELKTGIAASLVCLQNMLRGIIQETGRRKDTASVLCINLNITKTALMKFYVRDAGAVPAAVLWE